MKEGVGFTLTDKKGGFASGFTLIELAIVLAILSLIMLLAMPRLQSSNAEELKSSARSLAAILRYLGENAVTSRTQYRIHFNIRDSEIAIARRTGEGGEVPPDDPFLKRRIIAEGISIKDVMTARLGTVNEGEVIVDFDSGGIAEFVNVHLQDSAEKEYTVMAYPGSGKVKLYEGRQEPEMEL